MIFGRLIQGDDIQSRINLGCILAGSGNQRQPGEDNREILKGGLDEDIRN